MLHHHGFLGADSVQRQEGRVLLCFHGNWKVGLGFAASATARAASKWTALLALDVAGFGGTGVGSLLPVGGGVVGHDCSAMFLICALFTRQKIVSHDTIRK